MRIAFGCLIVCITALFAGQAQAAVSVADIFGSGMVLQRQMRVPVWGKAMPGEEVTVNFAGQKVTAKTGPDGRWKAILDPMEANATGGELLIAGPDNSIVFKDVLVGEVWLGSGQSNMVWELRSCLNAKEEIAQANYPGIRIFTAGYAPGDDQGYRIAPNLKDKRFALRPQEKVLGSWMVCTPANAPDFSGVGYFFARRIHQELNVPVGIIVSAFGATAIEAWINLEELKAIPAYRERAESFDVLAKAYLADPANYPKALEAQPGRLAAKQAKWFADLDAQDPGLINQWMVPELALQGWGRVILPVTLADNPIGAPVASIWFRKTVSLPESWVGKDLTLKLGVIDAVDEVYVNGVKVGRTWFDAKEYWNTSRTYQVPGSAITGPSAVVTMRLLKLNYQMAPFGPAADMCLKLSGAEPVSLAGEWRMKKARDLEAGDQPRPAPMAEGVPGGHYGQPGVMYNGLIHPIQPYAIRGMIWVHGGANSPFYIDYRSLLPGLIRSWRAQWGQGDFPVAIVQQQDFWEQQTAPVERGGHTNLRQSQTMALSVPGTMLVTALGLGMPNDPHPRNKQEFGRRLALAAMGRVYAMPILHSGPMYKSMAIQGDKVRLTFDYADGLHAQGTPAVGFAIAGADRTFYFAKAKIEGKSVVVWSDKVPEPVAVRYAWATNPVCNLYNAQELPVFPFATDTWDLSQIVIGKDTITIPTGWKVK